MTSTPNAPAKSAAMPHMEPLSIIVADDVEQIQDLLSTWLVAAGHTVACASTGREVSALLAKQRADLIITDVIMPDGDGLEVILELKRVQPDVRVLAISGGGKYFQASECLKLARGLGAHAILLKPFNRAQLLAAIEAALPPASGGSCAGAQKAG